MNPFDYLNSVNETKTDLSVDGEVPGYVAFIANRSLSYFSDTVLLANELNKYPQIPAFAQYQFLLNTVRKRKRFSKWVKPTHSDDIEVVKEYYGFSNEKAMDALTLLSPEQLQTIRSKVDKGGRH
jgi:Bacteriophage clamp loader A subunit